MFPKTIKERKFYFMMQEFDAEQDRTKFEPKNKKLFFKRSKNILMSKWFFENILLIKSIDMPLAKKIIHDFEVYEETYNKRKEEFAKLDNNKKFDPDNLTLFFSDKKVLMGKWFDFYREKLFLAKDEYSKEIVKQYLFSKNKKYVFLMEPDFEKFDIHNKKIRFSTIDNSIMSRWFYNNKRRLKKEDNEYSRKILKQFEAYKNVKNLKHRLIKDIKYIIRLKEFAAASQRKFYCKEILFSDDHIMFNWFDTNKKNILQTDNELCELISAQYNLFNIGTTFYSDEESPKKVK